MWGLHLGSWLQLYSLVAYTVSRTGREWHESLFHVSIEACVVEWVSDRQESFRVELAWFDPEGGGVLYGMQVDANDRLCLFIDFSHRGSIEECMNHSM